MPQNYVKELAKKHNISVEVAESEWSNAKKQAKKQGKPDNFAYITSIFKKMMGESKEISLKSYLSLMEDLENQSYDRAPTGDKNEFSFSTDTEEMDDISDEDFSDEYDFNDSGDLDSHEQEHADEDERIQELTDQISQLQAELDELQGGGEESPEDFGDDEDFDYDEEPTDELSDEDFSDEDFSQHKNHQLSKVIPPRTDDSDQYVEGHKFGILNDLLTEGVKRKKLKKAAKAVYHRDYEKTKNKVYRKYDKRPDYVKEGMWDYLKGAGAETADKFNKAKQGIQDIHAAGQKRSATQELTNVTQMLVNLIVKYRKLKADYNAKFVNEGAWDYLKGVGSEAANKVQKFSSDVHAAGQKSSMSAELQRLADKSNRAFDKMASLTRQLGPDSEKVVASILKTAPRGVALAIYNKLRKQQRA
jgi:hypothetical protein